jgi:hypothetical protein
VSNQTATITATNTTTQAQLQISTNLSNWAGASATGSNLSGGAIFKTPVSGRTAFFRVQD